jgi:hypothetical protein
MGGLTGAFLPRSLGHDDVGFLGQNNAGVDEVLTRNKTQQGTTARWLTVAAPLLRARTMVSGGSDAPPASKTSLTPSSWRPLAYPEDGLARAVAG